MSVDVRARVMVGATPGGVDRLRQGGVAAGDDAGRRPVGGGRRARAGQAAGPGAVRDRGSWRLPPETATPGRYCLLLATAGDR